MDQILAILASFPPSPEEIDTTKKYDAALKAHITTLTKMLDNIPPGVSAELGRFLEVSGRGFTKITKPFHLTSFRPSTPQ